MLVAETLEPTTDMRRFQVPDLNKHGAWLLPRLEKSFAITERMAATWLRSLIYSNDCMFLFHPLGLALAQRDNINTLQAKPIVRECFVWCQDPQDKEAQKQMAVAYQRFKEWAQNLGADIVIVGELTDIPPDLIKQHIGRVFVREQKFARV